MSSLLLSLPELLESYKTWISRNPQLTSDCETSFKWLSYFLAGKINNSHIVSEIVYCLSNLLVLLNDRIITNARQLELPSSANTLKLWLTVVEYCEVFFELAAQKIWGSVGKWFIVVSIQVFKCISRLLLIYSYKEGIIQTPSVPTLDRAKLLKPTVSVNHPVSEVTPTFMMRGSGRVVRKIEGSPPVSLRNWKPLQSDQSCDNEQTIEQALAGRQLISETIYIVKPITHLVSLACFGSESWKPWIVSLVMDLTSLNLYNFCQRAKINSLTPKQRLQLSKRTIALIMYLLRSPFYDRHSKDKLNALLMSLSRNVPLARLICTPLLQYLPFWQSNYFYMWST